MTKRFKKRLNEKEFHQAQELLKVGLSLRQVGEVLGRSCGTVYNIKKVKTWPEYQRRLRTILEKRFGKKVSPKGDIRALLMTIKESVDAIEVSL